MVGVVQAQSAGQTLQLLWRESLQTGLSSDGHVNGRLNFSMRKRKCGSPGARSLSRFRQLSLVFRSFVRLSDFQPTASPPPGKPTEHFAFSSNVRAETIGVKVSFVAVLIACAILLKVIRWPDEGVDIDGWVADEL